jgi:hypothetical protein
MPQPESPDQRRTTYPTPHHSTIPKILLANEILGKQNANQGVEGLAKDGLYLFVYQSVSLTKRFSATLNISNDRLLTTYSLTVGLQPVSILPNCSSGLAIYAC